MELLTVVYQILTFVFGGLLVLSILLGEMLEWVGDAVEGIADLFEGLLDLLPGVDGIELTGNIAWGDASESRVGLSRAILAFLAIFGASGWFFVAIVGPLALLSLLFATVFGTIGGISVYAIIRYLFKEGTAVREQEDYVGLSGMVVITIDEGIQGTVMVKTTMGTETLVALPYYGEHLSKGTIVNIVAMQGGVAYVSPASDKETLKPKGG